MDFVDKAPADGVEEVAAEKNELPLFCGDCDPDQSKLPPVERVVLPRDVVEIHDEDETVYVVGTRDGKVTVIDGLDHMKNLKVSEKSLPFLSFSLYDTSDTCLEILSYFAHGWC